MDIINNIVNQGQFFLERNILNEEVKDFLKQYGQLKGIKFPVENKYDRQLANTKSKAQVTKGKEAGILTGISLMILSFVLAFLTNSINTSEKNILNILGVSSFFAGGAVIFVQIGTKSKYNDSKAAKGARSIKKMNEINVKQFYLNSIEKVKLDYQRYISFLENNPDPGRIKEYKQNECKLCIERELFEQTVQYKIQKLKEQEAAQALLKATSTVAKLGLRVAEINELNEMNNTLNDISSALEDFA
ncbi:MAG TPA: hypothetical protein V6C71_27115 [Coleofasciculaceae cyanobacterium]|jgi:hypothetical protein